MTTPGTTRPGSRGLTVRAGAATDVGRVRQHNEDSLLADRTVFVVADGMGGHAAGEVASRIAAETVVELAARPSVRRGTSSPRSRWPTGASSSRSPGTPSRPAWAPPPPASPS